MSVELDRIEEFLAHLKRRQDDNSMSETQMTSIWRLIAVFEQLRLLAADEQHRGADADRRLDGGRAQ